MTASAIGQIECWLVSSLTEEGSRVRISLPAVPRPGETVIVRGGHGRHYLVREVAYAGEQHHKPVDDEARPGHVLLVVIEK